MRRFLFASLLLASSMTARVSLAQDTTPPTLLSATWTAYPSRLLEEDPILDSTNHLSSEIKIVFSERMNTNDGNPASALVPGNYKVKSGAATRNVNNVELSPGTPRSTRYLTLFLDGELDLTRDWTLTAINVTDTNDNVIVTNANASTIPLTTAEVIVHRTANWRFADEGYEGRADHKFFDNSWAQIGFNPDDFAWKSAGGAFFLGSDGTPPVDGNYGLCCFDDVLDDDRPSKTYYFRREVDVSSGSLFNSLFKLRYMVGDGVVMYVNGKEAWRLNIRPGAPTYDTIASSAGSQTWRPTGNGPEGTNFLTLPLSDFLRPGTNLIAAEVHVQNVGDGARAAWGLELVHEYINRNAGALKIFSHPKDVTNAVEGGSATFEVKPDGKSPYAYKWQVVTTNNVTNVIAGATNRVLNLENIPLSFNAGRVAALVTGGTPSSTLASSNAILRLTPDLTAPTLVSAVYDASVKGVVVQFSELMKSASLLNKANYVLTSQTGQAITISSISNIDGRSIVLLTATAPTVGSRWTLSPINLTDNAAAANALPATRTATVGGEFTLVPMVSDWRYYENGTNGPVTTNWVRADYTEVPGWQTGKAVFADAFVTIPDEQTLSIKRFDDLGNIILTYYFRKTFDFTGSTNGLTISVDHLVDDGMVVWLNGSIVYRFNMAASGALNYNTFANVEVVNAELRSAIMTNALPIAGKNQIAVEVHKRNASDLDIVFGMQLKASYSTIFQTNASLPPTIAITAPAANAPVTQGATLAITANATPAAGATITKVEAFDGATKIGEDLSSPYAINYVTSGTTAIGDHTIRVVATDSKGVSAEATVLVKVLEGVVTRPPLTVTLSVNRQNAALTWPAAPGFILESSPSVTTPNWQVVAGNPVSGVSVPVAGAPKYYRLRKP